jgi:hypothetical protein
MRRRIGTLSLGTLMAVGFITAGVPSLASAAPAVPVVRLVSPGHGPLSGGTFVDITGGDFDGATAVDFGTTPAPTGWYVKAPDTIKAIAPPASAAGTVVVTVTTGGGTSSSTATTTDVFTYVSGPTIQSVSPGAGATTGGTRVTIAGQGFTGATSVTFGGTSAGFTLDSATEISAIAPTGPSGGGTVPVVVTATAGATPADPAADFTYAVQAPIVDAVEPSSGGAGLTVTITGSRFEKNPKKGPVVTKVFFGANPATSVVVKSSRSITCVVPAGAGTVDVTVVDPKGTSAINQPGDQFTYTS